MCYTVNMNDYTEIEDEYMLKVEELLRERLGVLLTERYGQVPLGINYTPHQYFMAQMGECLTPLLVEVKGEVSSLTQLRHFSNFAKDFEGMSLLVAGHIDDKVKNKLREMAIGFYEVDREIYFPFHYSFEGNLSEDSSGSRAIAQKGFRAESSMKLLLYFVCKPKSLEYTQRELAKLLDMSLGAVNKSLKDLAEKRLVITSRKRRYLGKFDEIADRWRISFADHLRKNFTIGTFSPLGDDFYKRWRTDYIWNSSCESDESYEWSKTYRDLGIFWGGEAAASIRTGYLTPELFQIYTYDDRIAKILKTLLLKKDPEGIVKIAKCFWPQELNANEYAAPDFVTYCELLNSGIDRNLEAAEVLKDKIRQRIKQYEY